MSETNPPMPPVPAPEDPQAPPASSGSLLAGVGLAWAIMVAGVGLGCIGDGIGGGFAGLLLALLVIIVWSAVWIAGTRRRTGLGMLLGLASIAAVVILLVAACFGLFALNY